MRSLVSLKHLPISSSVYSLSIPLRQKVSHSAAERTTVEPVVAAIELRNGTIGYGETLPRLYVTGESVASVLADIETTLNPALLEFHPATFGEACERAIDSGGAGGN